MKGKKIIFVNPPLTAEESYGKLAAAGSHLPPLGLCVLAAVARDEGYTVKILDSPALGYTYDDAFKWISKERPDYVAIAAVTLTIHKAAKLADMLKKANKNIKIIIGGPHISSTENVAIKTMNLFKSFDVGISGEAEFTLKELLPALDNEKDLKKIQGLVVRDKSKVIVTSKRPFIENLDDVPFPAWDLLPDLAKNYRPAAFSFNKLPSTVLVTSRGCPGGCTFCHASVFGLKYRAFSADYLIKMVDHLYYKYGIRDILFLDDIFVLFKERTKKFCEHIVKNKMNLSWACQSRIDLVNPEILKIMKEAGCWQISYGIESGSQKILDDTKKRITLDQIREAVKWTKDSGIRSKGFFMIGLPTETRQTINDTMRFMKELPLDEVEVTLFTPFPGIEEYERAQRLGNLKDNWDQMSEYNVVFTPKGISEKELLSLQKRALIGFYLRPRIIFGYLKMINSFGQVKKLFLGAKSLLNLAIS